MASSTEYVLNAVFASLPRTIRGMPVSVNASPNGEVLVYCNGNSVFLRDLKNANKCEIYTEHANPTMVAKYSPSSFYIASGDQSGKVRIWDATQSEHILKAEYPVVSGPVRDIAWSDDSKRLAVVGEGRERFGHVFLFDTGTSNGNLSGQSRTMTSVDFRPARPYRLVSGSEDHTVAIFEGPPFKFLTLFHEHSRFVYCVRYNSNGAMFATAGADGKVVVYDGATGDKQGDLVDENCKGTAHAGSVFGLCWSPDGQSLATASGDKTVKVWNAATKKLEKTFTIGTTVDDQQLSVVWTKTNLISVSLTGFINYLDLEHGSVTKVLKGHNKPITALAVCPEKNVAFTADFEGNITRWDLSSGHSERITPAVHKTQVSGMSLSPKGELLSVAWDDTISYTASAFEVTDKAHSNKTKLPSQPRGLALSRGDGRTAVVACQKAVIVFTDERQTASENIAYEATCADINPDSKRIAVGGQDGKVHIYALNGSSLEEIKSVTQSGSITSVTWSPNGNFLVATDTSRKVVPYAVEKDYKSAAEKDWTFHAARVNCSAWSPDNRFVATGSIDTNIIIWDLKNSGEHPIIIKGAHTMSSINGIAWVAPRQILSAGQDSVLKLWTINV